MSVLQDNLNKIKVDKATNLLPENLKAGITCLGVKGTYEGGSNTNSNIHLFETIDEMNNSTDNNENDLAVVYRTGTQNWDGTSAITSLTFPKTVVLSEVSTGSCDGMYEGYSYIFFNGDISSTSAYFSISTGANSYEITYTSEDGLTYIRTDSNDETITLSDSEITFRMYGWDDVCSNFIQAVTKTFEGLYQYNTDLIDKIIFYSPLFSNVNVSYDGTGSGTYDIDYTNKQGPYFVENIKTSMININSELKLSYIYGLLYKNTSDELILAVLSNGGYPELAYEGNTFTGIRMYTSTSDTSLLLYKINTTDYSVSIYKQITSDITINSNYAFSASNLDISTLPTFILFNQEGNSFAILNYVPSYMYVSSSLYVSPVINLSETEFYRLYDTYLLAPTQLNASASRVYENTFYSKNGVETGTLQNAECENKDELNLKLSIWNTYNEGIICPEDCSNLYQNSGTTALPSVSLLDTSKVTDMSYMFNNCSTLTELDVTNFDTSNVTNMLCMFSGCRALTTIDVTNFNTVKVKNMSWLFGQCSGITELDLSSFDTSNVTDMTWMFKDCSSLTSLNVSSFNTSSVTKMTNMFYGCSSLTSLDLSSFDTSNVTDMYTIFQDCSSLTSLDLSNFDTSKITSMSSMFYNCSSLTSLDLSNFDTSNVANMAYMFYGCSSLTSLDLSSFDFSKVTNYTNMFSNVPTDCLIYVKDETAKSWITGKFTTLTNVQVKEKK